MSGVRHFLSHAGVKISAEQARQLEQIPALRTEARVLAYVWELGRRAVGRSKGSEVHVLWRSLPVETRKALDVERVEIAKAALIAQLNAEQATGKTVIDHGQY